MVVFDDDQVTVLVMFSVVLSLKVPVAVNCCWVWRMIAGVAGVTAIDTRVAVVTVSAAGGLVTDPRVAVIDVVPAATPVASPCVPCELLIVAMAGAVDAHVTVDVMTFVLPSAYVPVAVNCCVKVAAMDAVRGVTAIETSGLVIVRTAVPEMVPWAAMMVEVVLGVTPVAKPPVVMVAPTEALQVTLDVMICVLWSA